MDQPRNSVAQPVRSERTWQVGTLTYTLGGLVALFVLLLLGDFAWSMRDRSVGQMAQWYLAELKVPSVLFAALISSFPALIALLLGPIIGVRSDRHRGKWGRRIPYLLITTPCAVVGMVGLGLVPYIANWVHDTFAPSRPLCELLERFLGDGAIATRILETTRNEMFISVLCFGVFWACFEFATIAGQSVFGGLINDVVPQELMGRFFGMFRAISLIDGILFNKVIFGHVTDHFTLILICIALFYGVCFISVCLMVKEGTYPPTLAAPPSSGRILASFFHEIRSYLRECFGNRYYILVFFLLMTANITFAPVNTFNLPFSKSLQITPQTYGDCVSLTFTISLVMAYPLGWLVDRFHPLQMVLATLFVYCIVALISGLFIRDVSTFIIAFVAHGVISGCFFTSVGSLNHRLYPRTRYAQFASAAGILSSIAGIILTPTVGFVIDYTGQAYRYAYLTSFLLAASALLFGWRVYIRFIRYGGPKNYVAPE